MCTKSITDSLTYSIFSPCLGNPPWLTANTLTTLTLEIMTSISCEGLQYYWVTCDERNHHSSSKYNFPEILNWYNQFKCSKKNIEKGWELGSSQRSSRAAGCCSAREQNKQLPEMWLFSETHLMFVDSCEWVILVWSLCDWAVSICGRNSFNAKIFARTQFYLGSLVSEGTPPELGGVCLGDAEIVALKVTIGEDGL